MRISDADRQRAVSELTRHCGDGRLTLDELEERIDEVHAATDDAGLRHAFRELPPFRIEPAPTDPPLAPFPRERAGRSVRSQPAGRCGTRMVGVPPCFVVPLVILALVTWKVLLVVLFLMVVLPVRATRAVVASRA